MLIWFLPIFLFFLLVGLPVFFALLAAPGLMLWLNGQERDITLLYRNVYNGIETNGDIDVILIELGKSFDKVNHQSNYRIGIRGRVFNVF